MSRKKDLISLLDFIKFTHQFQKVERVVLVPREKRWENDAEHSFQLAFVAWYLVEHNNLQLNLFRVVALSLVHDLVETYAGDTYIYDEQSVLDGKREREEKAVRLLKENFPGFTSLHELIAEYETRETLESRFVYALDKLLPVLNIYLDQGRTWQKKNITLDKLMVGKEEKISLSSEVFPYYEWIIAILKQSKRLFPEKKLPA